MLLQKADFHNLPWDTNVPLVDNIFFSLVVGEESKYNVSLMSFASP